MAKQEKILPDIIPEQLAEILAEAVTPVAPPSTRASELKTRVMARISGKKSFAVMTIKATEGDWITLLRGVQKKILNKDSATGMQSYLLRMEAGATLPAHEHTADEECLMLEGDAMVGDIHLSAGDYHFARKGSRHGSVSTQNGCLAFLRSYEAIG